VKQKSLLKNKIPPSWLLIYRHLVEIAISVVFMFPVLHTEFMN